MRSSFFLASNKLPHTSDSFGQKQRERREVTQPGAQAAAGAIATGSTVFVPQFRAKARVLSVTGADLLVQVGSVKMKVKRSNVQYPCP